MTNQSITPKWNLSDLYTGLNDPQLEKDFAVIDERIEMLKAYRGRVATLSSEEYLALTKSSEDLSFISHKIGLFAGLYESTHVGDAEATRFSKQIDEKMITRFNEILFIAVEESQMSEEQWQEHLSAELLKPYRYTILESYRAAKHVLSEPEEKIMSEKSQTSWNTLNHLYEVTTDTLEVDWKGEKITLEQLLTKFREPDAEIRKEAALVLHTTIETNKKTTPPIYNALVQDKAISDKLRKRDYPEQSRFESDDVDQETVNALVEAVSAASDLVTRYYTLKKKIMGVDKMYWWDRYAPLPQAQTKISPDEGIKMVLEAFEEFSPRMREITQTMLDKEHIDWLPEQNKRGGAFCAMSGRDIYPYVLLNYTNDVNDVMTLAHELGHAIHDVMAQENNVFLQTHPSLALAEIASTFGESLLFDKLLAGDISKEDKIALLMSNIEDNFATVFRQIAMFQFEQKVHKLRREEGELSKEQLDTLWHDTMKAPFEGALEYTDEHKNTWMYVSHVFRSPFYVYSYAFAQLCTLALYEQYKEKGKDFAKTYETILMSGGSKSPKDTLAEAGLDITSPSFWQDGIKIIEGYISELDAEVK